MAYTSPAEIRAIERRLPQAMTDADLEVYIERAEAYIDAKLGEVYRTPFLAVPKLIRHIATDLAIYFMYESLYSSQKPNLDETIGQRLERINSMLDDIMVGNLSLLPEASPFSGKGVRYGTSSDVPPIFDYEQPEW